MASNPIGRNGPPVIPTGVAGNPIARPGSLQGPIPAITIGRTDASGQLRPGAMQGATPEQTQLMTASRDAILPILYGGPERVAGKVYIVKVVGTTLYLAMLLCEGGAQGIDSIGTVAGDNMTGIFVNDVDASSSSGIAVHKHLGTAGQTADSWLTAAITSPVAFAEALAGTAYAVYQIQAGAFTGFPRIVATVKGLKIFDPRQNLLPFSNTLSSWSATGGTCAVAQSDFGPYGASNYAWVLTDADGVNMTGRTIAFTITSGATAYVWSVKLKKTSGGTSKTFGINVNLSGGTGVASNTRVNTDTGATSGGTGVTVTDLGTFWQVSGTITDNSSGNNALGVAIYPATANNGSFVDTGAAQGSATVCELQVRKSTTPVGYVETTAGTAYDQPTQWSDNAALCLGDFLSSTTYGEGRTVDQSSLASAAEYCDQMVGMTGTGTYTWSGNVVTVTSTAHGIANGASVAIVFTSGSATANATYAVNVLDANTFNFTLIGSGTGGNVKWGVPALNEKRSRITLLLDTRQPVRTWRDTLRAYVPAWVIFDNGVAFIKVDQTGSTDHTFDSTNIDQNPPPKVSRGGLRDTPNAVVISYTDTSVTPWRTVTAEANTGASPRRATRIDMPGIRSYSQALRTATSRLNHYTIEDLTGEINVFDYGLKVLPGDIASITDDIGITGLLARVLSVQDQGHGRWRIQFRKYDVNAYSSTVQTTPARPDMQPPDPNSPPAVTGLGLVADRRQESGVWKSRIRATWNPITSWPYVRGFIVELYDPGVAATYTWSGNVVTVTSASHGLAVNDSAYLDFTSGGATSSDGGYMVASVPNGNTYTVALTGSGTSGNVTWQKLREHAQVVETYWYSAPVLLDVQYSVRVRVISTTGVIGP